MSKHSSPKSGRRNGNGEKYRELRAKGFTLLQIAELFQVSIQAVSQQTSGRHSFRIRENERSQSVNSTEYHAKWRQANREKIREQHINWRLNNPDKARQNALNSLIAKKEKISQETWDQLADLSPTVKTAKGKK